MLSMVIKYKIIFLIVVVSFPASFTTRKMRNHRDLLKNTGKNQTEYHSVPAMLSALTKSMTVGQNENVREKLLKEKKQNKRSYKKHESTTHFAFTTAHLQLLSSEDDDENEVDGSNFDGNKKHAIKTWDTWGKWSDCSVTCGTGRMTRWRHCISGACADGEKEAQIKSCLEPDC